MNDSELDAGRNLKIAGYPAFSPAIGLGQPVKGRAGAGKHGFPTAPALGYQALSIGAGRFVIVERTGMSCSSSQRRAFRAVAQILMPWRVLVMSVIPLTLAR